MNSAILEIPLEQTPYENPVLLYTYNFTTASYLRTRRIVDLQEISILDLQSASGYSTLALALANPNAEITSVACSNAAVALAQKRLQYHGIENVRFQTLSFDRLEKIDREFDYINVENVLDQFPDAAVGLQTLQSKLKSEGIIRVKVDSAIARFYNYQAQRFFAELGLLQNSPSQAEVAKVREIMGLLKNGSMLKELTWLPQYSTEAGDAAIVRDYLFNHARGFRFPELFDAMEAANLEFISMVQAKQWDLQRLFKDIEDLPIFLTLRLAEMSLSEQLQLFELLNPIHPTLEFWCGHPQLAELEEPPAEWTDADWQTARVSFHPQLRTPALYETMQNAIVQQQALELTQFLPIVPGPLVVDSLMVACLLPLVTQILPVSALVENWQRLRPLNPLTLEPTTEQEAWGAIAQLLVGLEELGYIFLERAS
ncbi:methyltransferase domain-containing protein [Kamptonema cortianum]|uniref:Methyltransferase domain-containing protein n=1 Tax=Geitlerinema calcuttense NRMC-F 0142 TaxID=2922238 RepID=A0ABT7M066_9CYAN|nr:methyltransferase domain-containing protein [Geitlerinema calcuttense]MDK3160110.1 methyltransferase domain-containing protein [Kamptonema cortianum]MDL5057641.1 methyltransferase domain-containing protein [Geitlerinema calcuttense NRMC-F 0142]